MGDNNSDSDYDAEEEMDQFKKVVQDYLQLESEIKRLNEGISVRRKKKKELCATLLAFIQENDIPYLNLEGDYQGKRLACKTSETKTSLKAEDFKIVLEENLKDEDMINKLYECVLQKRVVKTKHNIAISRPKKEKVSEKLANAITNSVIAPDNMDYLDN